SGDSARRLAERRGPAGGLTPSRHAGGHDVLALLSATRRYRLARHRGTRTHRLRPAQTPGTGDSPAELPTAAHTDSHRERPSRPPRAQPRGTRLADRAD